MDGPTRPTNHRTDIESPAGRIKAIGTWVPGGGVTLVVGKLGAGAGRRSNGECRLRGIDE